jgi:hypothetical protein
MGEKAHQASLLCRCFTHWNLDRRKVCTGTRAIENVHGLPSGTAVTQVEIALASVHAGGSSARGFTRFGAQGREILKQCHQFVKLIRLPQKSPGPQAAKRGQRRLLTLCARGNHLDVRPDPPEFTECIVAGHPRQGHVERD